MKRLLLILLLCSLPAFSRQRIQGWCEQGGSAITTTGKPSNTLVQQSYPNCVVTIYLAGTLTKATTYSDDNGTVLANPFIAQKNAMWFAYVDDGIYDVTQVGGTGGGGGSTTSTIFYQIVASSGMPFTPRPTLNFSSDFIVTDSTSPPETNIALAATHSYSTTFTSQSTVTLAHNFNNLNVLVGCRDSASPAHLLTGAVTYSNSNTAIVTFTLPMTGTCWVIP